MVISHGGTIRVRLGSFKKSEMAVTGGVHILSLSGARLHNPREFEPINGDHFMRNEAWGIVTVLKVMDMMVTFLSQVMEMKQMM